MKRSLKEIINLSEKKIPEDLSPEEKVIEIENLAIQLKEMRTNLLTIVMELKDLGIGKDTLANIRGAAETLGANADSLFNISENIEV